MASNSGGPSGSVRHLNTRSFSDTREAYDNYITRFEEIVQGINRTSNQLLDNWHGKGKSAFRKSFNQIGQNLQDLHEIMTDLQKSLKVAQEAYEETDATVAQNNEH